MDHLLPLLQGSSADFVFTQLPTRFLSDYQQLVAELNNRYRLIETPKTFAARFSKRDQKHSETAEEYAAELKRLYDKAHQGRDPQTREEDLVRRFLNGLKNEEARFEVEYNKEPTNINEAVFHVVNYIQTRKSTHDTYSDKKYKKYVRRTSVESSEDEDSTVENDYEHAYRLNLKPEMRKTPIKKEDSKIVNKNTNMGTPELSSKPKLDTDPQKDIINQLLERIAKLESSRGAEPIPYRKPQFLRGKEIICYGCREQGHMVRDCPNTRNNTQQNSGYKPAYAFQNRQTPYGKPHTTGNNGTSSANPLNY